MDISSKENSKPLPNGIVQDHHFPGFRDLKEAYEKLAKIGQGTFGEVFKARDRKTGNHVALKKVMMENEKEGFPITALREIKILQLLKNKNVVRLLEICGAKLDSEKSQDTCSFCLVFEFCEHDLAGLLQNSKVRFTLPDIKKIIQQILNGLYYIHHNNILHRDLKPANILITKAGILKLADFGLARAFSLSKAEPNRYTNRVVTLWYRPPELLLGERNYGPAIDIWGAGCIFAEMWTRCPIMQGGSEQHQINLINNLCGTISTDVWPLVDQLDLFSKIELPKQQKRRVKERLKSHIKDPFALELLDRMLILDPRKRIDSDAALDHDFFWSDPMPSDLAKTMAQHSQSMFEFLIQRNKNNAKNVPKPRLPNGQHFDQIF